MRNMKMAKGERHENAKSLHHIEVKEAENGGHVVTHHFKHGDGAYHEPEEHVFGADQGKEAMDHIASAANISHEPSESEGEETGENTEEA